MSGVVLCPFWRVWRASFGVRVCDNLVGGVPACVVAEFYPDTAAMNYPDDVVVCRHFVRTDALYHVPLKRDCYFGGVCIHPDAVGFDACFGSCVRSGCVGCVAECSDACLRFHAFDCDVMDFSVCVGCSRFLMS